jgi:hypothetical protein
MKLRYLFIAACFVGMAIGVMLAGASDYHPEPTEVAT